MKNCEKVELNLRTAERGYKTCKESSCEGSFGLVHVGAVGVVFFVLGVAAVGLMGK